MEKYGFIYVWYDKKNKKFYVGRHWGTDSDGYICSSKSMREAHRRRPEDFKRRIVSKTDNKNDLIIEEQRWLNMINPNEVGNRYYNKTLKATTPSTTGFKHSNESKRKISESNKGKIRSEEFKQKLRESANRQFSDPEQRKILSDKSKELWKDEDYVKRVKQSMKNGVNDEVRRIRSDNMKRINMLRWNKSNHQTNTE
ncbi:hypothetical protein EB001_19935 [bacterium]|jgi:hypothetical protein|nr:hypothetical protein [bacterium]